MGKQIRRSLIALLLVHNYAFAQFKGDAIGVAYLNDQNKGTYSLTLAFPTQMLSESPSDETSFTFSGTVKLFDEKGELASIQGPLIFRIKLWCENDGGIQSRPALEVVIDKTKLKRKLTGKKEIQDIACFVIANSLTVQSGSNIITSSKDVVMSGDSNDDGKMDCFIPTYYDDAENCAGQPANHLGINLNVAGVSYALRCCGP